MLIPSWLAPAAVVLGFGLQLAALWRMAPAKVRLCFCVAGAVLVLPAALWQRDALLAGVQLLLLPPLWFRLKGANKP